MGMEGPSLMCHGTKGRALSQKQQMVLPDVAIVFQGEEEAQPGRTGDEAVGGRQAERHAGLPPRLEHSRRSRRVAAHPRLDQPVLVDLRFQRRLSGLSLIPLCYNSVCCPCHGLTGSSIESLHAE